jgi:fumarate reductase subunit D
MEAGPAAPSEEPGYTGAAVAGAVLATVFFPLIALIAALLLQGGQTDPTKRSQLRTWAWVSGGLLVFEAVVLVILASVTL